VDAIHVDLADLRGYHYYTGVKFSVFAQDDNGAAVECGRGGRYDGVGRAFGRARPATGFSIDLRRLATRVEAARDPRVIVAPADDDAALAKAIDELRAKGEAVVVALPGETRDGACRLVHRNERWVVE
jgi:ATP phosphoribosyltransferase regulatory subunit